MAYSLKIMLLAFLSAGFFASKGQVLTIQDAVDQAVLNNAQINQMRSLLKQKNEAWRMQSGISSPEVSYMKEGMSGKTADPFQEQRLTVSQTVDFPLTTSYRMKAIR